VAPSNGFVSWELSDAERPPRRVTLLFEWSSLAKKMHHVILVRTKPEQQLSAMCWAVPHSLHQGRVLLSAVWAVPAHSCFWKTPWILGFVNRCVKHHRRETLLVQSTGFWQWSPTSPHACSQNYSSWSRLGWSKARV